MEENIFADVPREGETLEEVLNPVEKELEVEKPAESQAEKEEVKEVDKLELPDEAILKKNSAWEEMRESREQAEAKAQQLEQRLQALEKEKGEVEQPAFLTEIVGKNEEVAREWQKERETLKEEVKQELVQAQIDAQKKEAEAKEHWNKWTEEQLTKVGAKDENTRNELRKVMNDYTPTDERGWLDYSKGMKLLNDLKKVQIKEEEMKIQVKKNIADATVSRETSTKETKNYLTRNDLRGGWRGIVHKD